MKNKLVMQWTTNQIEFLLKNKDKLTVRRLAQQLPFKEIDVKMKIMELERKSK